VTLRVSLAHIRPNAPLHTHHVVTHTIVGRITIVVVVVVARITVDVDVDVVASSAFQCACSFVSSI